MTRAQAKASLAPGLGWLALFLLLPCALLILNAVLVEGPAGGEAPFTLAYFERAFAPPVRDILLASLRIAGLATLIALLVGYPAAHAIALAPPRRQAALLVLVMLPFFSSALIRSYAWVVLLDGDGLIPAVLQGTGLTDVPARLLEHQWSVVLGLVYSYLPFVVLAVYVTVRGQDRALLEASTNLGASAWRSFLRISLPLTLPGAVAGALFVFVLSLGNFITPDLLGGRQVPMLGPLIYDQFLVARDWPFGSALAALLIAVMLLLLLVQALLVGARRERNSRGRRR